MCLVASLKIPAIDRHDKLHPVASPTLRTYVGSTTVQIVEAETVLPGTADRTGSMLAGEVPTGDPQTRKGSSSTGPARAAKVTRTWRRFWQYLTLCVSFSGAE